MKDFLKGEIITEPNLLFLEHFKNENIPANAIKLEEKCLNELQTLQRKFYNKTAKDHALEVGRFGSEIAQPDFIRFVEMCFKLHDYIEDIGNKIISFEMIEEETETEYYSPLLNIGYDVGESAMYVTRFIKAHCEGMNKSFIKNSLEEAGELSSLTPEETYYKCLKVYSGTFGLPRAPYLYYDDVQLSSLMFMKNKKFDQFSNIDMHNKVDLEYMVQQYTNLPKEKIVKYLVSKDLGRYPKTGEEYAKRMKSYYLEVDKVEKCKRVLYFSDFFDEITSENIYNELLFNLNAERILTEQAKEDATKHIQKYDSSNSKLILPRGF